MPTIYTSLKKALYVTLQAAMLFWKDLNGTFKDWGFELSPYGHFSANKNIDGSHYTILWHLNDHNISHVELKVVDNIIDM